MSSPATAIKLPTWPHFAEDEIAAVADVLRSGRVNYWTGTEGREFEREWAAYVGTKHGIVIMNGTVTMELALIALGIGPGDEVIIPPRTFMATATAVMVRGATPVFADIDRDSGCITAASISAVLTSRTKAVIPVHLGGWPCDMKAILDLCRPLRIAVIEDCAQAHGATIDGKSVGSFGVINSWSFCQDKIMTLGGEGGAITVDDDELWARMWAYKDHGKSYDAVYNRPHGPGFRWVNEGIGTNWRLTEMQSALARVQLRKLPEWVALRRRNALVLYSRLSSVLRVPVLAPGFEHAYYRWYGYLDRPLKDGWTRQRICDTISERGVWCQVGSCSEIYLEKAFDGTGYRPSERLPVAQELGENSICLLVHPTLSEGNMQEMADVVESVMTDSVS